MKEKIIILKTKEAQKQMDQIENEIKNIYQKHPEIEKAMNLFRISEEKYQMSINSLYKPVIVTKNSTTLGE
jgi:hypothetical protein